MKVAIVHEWFDVYAGSEKVVEQILNIYPEADLFAVVDFLPDNQRDFIKGKKVTTTFISSLPFAKKKFRSYLPLMPLAIEQLNLTGYDIVISSSHAVSKGVITGPDQLHVSYVHSPIRYAWDLQHQYLHESGLDRGIRSWLVRYLLHRVRKWDVTTSNRVDCFVANSNFIKRRITKVYRRDSKVIFPPVAVSDFSFTEKKKDFYLTASRMVPYKKMDIIVDAFTRMPEKRLKVIGTGSELKKIGAIAKGHSNIELLGYQSFSNLKANMQDAKGFIFAAEEDFGITPVEAQACGTPVIGYGKGGVLDSVVDGKTGVLFDHQTAHDIVLAIQKFEQLKFDPREIWNHAQQFSNEEFKNSFGRLVTEQWDKFNKN